MKVKFVLILSCLVLFSWLNALAFDYPQKGGGRPDFVMGDADMGHRWEKIVDKLELTKEQKKSLREQKHASKRKRIEASNELKLKMHDLKYELEQDKINDSTVNKLIDEISAVQKSMLKNKVSSLKEMRKIFTDEQWEKVKSMKMMH